MTQNPENAVNVLREVWTADGTDSAELAEVCGNTKPCRTSKHMSFDGYAESHEEVGPAWREKLRREGKLTNSGGTIRDLVMGRDAAKN